VKDGLKISQMRVGQTHEHKFLVTEEVIELFARATGDFNPLHLDEEYARKTIFKARVAHGMLSVGVISGVLGTQFPGPGTIYLSQTVRFLKPVFLGDEITVRVKVLELIPDKKRARLETTCLNQNGQVVVSGEAQVMPSS